MKSRSVTPPPTPKLPSLLFREDEVQRRSKSEPPAASDGDGVLDPPPPEKKQKVNADDGNDSCPLYSLSDVEPLSPTWMDEEFSCYQCDSEDDYWPDNPQQKKIDQAVWDKYCQQIKESDGFDIEDYPGSCFMVTVWPMSYYLNSIENYNRLKGYAERALELYNGNERTNWKLDKVLKLNGGGCRYYHYYLTCSVKTPEGEVDFFQVKAVQDIDGSVEFPIFRIKPKKS